MAVYGENGDKTYYNIIFNRLNLFLCADYPSLGI